jgi:hypothetical protein
MRFSLFLISLGIAIFMRRLLEGDKGESALSWRDITGKVGSKEGGYVRNTGPAKPEADSHPRCAALVIGKHPGCP